MGCPEQQVGALFAGRDVGRANVAPSLGKARGRGAQLRSVRRLRRARGRQPSLAPRSPRGVWSLYLAAVTPDASEFDS